jgi:dextranase
VAFGDLKTRYDPSREVEVEDLPPGTEAVVCRTAFGEEHHLDLRSGRAVSRELPAGTHAFEAWSGDQLLEEEFATIDPAVGSPPVMAFATSFVADEVDRVLTWLRALRCTVVQVYDWMERYSAPLPSAEDYEDPLGRRLSRSALGRLVDGIHDLGAVAQAYAPVVAADPAFARSHREWMLVRNDGAPQALGDLLDMMDPETSGWQEHWTRSYLGAAEQIGFDGFHLDTYGYPRRAFLHDGSVRPMDTAYRVFVERIRAAAPCAALSLNQVNGFPGPFPLPAPPAFRYVEVWRPNDRWRHLEALLARSAGKAAARGVLALYPPVWEGERWSALRTVCRSEAVATALGSSLLVLGDREGALSGPYYPDHEELDAAEAAHVLEWHRFALRSRDLFSSGTDTSWVDIGDENGAVQVEAWGTPVGPEPSGGGVFARVVRSGPVTAVSCLDLSGSANGSWAEPTAAGIASEVQVRVLVSCPERCRAEVATLDAAGGRFRAAQLREVAHREGRAVELSLPLQRGWAVARVTES